MNTRLRNIAIAFALGLGMCLTAQAYGLQHVNKVTSPTNTEKIIAAPDPSPQLTVASTLKDISAKDIAFTGLITNTAASNDTNGNNAPNAPDNTALAQTKAINGNTGNTAPAENSTAGPLSRNNQATIAGINGFDRSDQRAFAAVVANTANCAAGEVPIASPPA